LRNSSVWNATAFILTYDEHGGFYDHVAPPQTNVPNPDGKVSVEGFKFDRLGVRVPFVVASPWIHAGTVVHEPTGPTPDSQYEHTSTMSTVNKMLGLTGHMSARAAWSGTFENIFSRETPRDDCPMTIGPQFPEWTEEDNERQRAKPLNDHLATQVDYYCANNGFNPSTCNSEMFTNQGEASDFILRQVSRLMARIAAENAASTGAAPMTSS